jgi:hypothetical protein
MKIEIAIINGVAGKSLSINNTRVAGPKPWGGGRPVDTFLVEEERILDAIGHKPEDLKVLAEKAAKWDKVKEMADRFNHPLTQGCSGCIMQKHKKCRGYCCEVSAVVDALDDANPLTGQAKEEGDV